VLCKPQAEAAGWVPAELAARQAEQAPRQSRTRALRERLSRAAESARARPAEEDGAADEAPRAADEAPRAADEAPPRRGWRLIVEKPDPEPTNGAADARAPRRSRERRRPERPVLAPRGDGPQRARRTVDRFNSSEARRTVAGLIRSLGEPHASVAIGGRGKPSTVTVAWEISWYQWAIDPGEHGEVREIGKGKEIEELSEGARRWNARITDDGSLRVQVA
jgi:hypothetical protein